MNSQQGSGVDGLWHLGAFVFLNWRAMWEEVIGVCDELINKIAIAIKERVYK